MEKTNNNEVNSVQQENNNAEETNKLDVIKRRISKTTDFLRTGYHNRQHKKVAPLMTTIEENDHRQNTEMKIKTKLERKNAINTEKFQIRVQNENCSDESSEDEDNWDSLLIPCTEFKTEELFSIVYHQCNNLVGQDIVHGFGKNTINSYIKRVFEFYDEKSETLIRNARNKRYPKLLLKVNILKTKSVLPRDIFSASDLFYVFWISSDPTNGYYGKIAKNEQIPPVMDQTIKLPFSSNTEDNLRFELRDFGPSEDIAEGKICKSSVIVKEDKNIIESIASTQIMLKDIPSTGQIKWITLNRRAQNGCCGKIQLKITFGSEEDSKFAFERHISLVKILFKHLMAEKNHNLNDWKGSFSPEAGLILRQHMIQSNLNKQDDLIAKWAAYIDVIQNNSINFTVFDVLLEDLLLSSNKMFFTKKKRKYFWNSARKIMALCYKHIKNFRKTVISEKEVIGQLYAILSILHNIANCEIPFGLNLFPAELYEWIENTDVLSFQTVLHEAVVQGTCEWFDFLVNDNNLKNDSDEEKLNQMLKVVGMVLHDLENGMDFHGIFIKKVTQMMEKWIPKICQGIKPLEINECYHGNVDRNSFTLSSTLNTLFFEIQKFEKIGANLFWNDDSFETLPIRKFHSWFFPVVVTWLDIANLKAKRQIDEAVNTDDFTPTDSTVLHSSSADDTLNIMYQVKKFWDQLEWPDVENRYSFLVKIIENIFSASIHYADLIIGKINCVDGKKKRYSINDWCVAIINIDFIFHKIQPFVITLEVDKLINSLSDSKSLTAADRCKRTLNRMMSNSFENTNQKIIDLLETFSKKMEPSMFRFLQEGAELLHQQPKVIDCLMEYLDENLISLNSKLNSEIFNNLLDVIWEKISNLLFFLIEDGIEKKRPNIYFCNLRETLYILIGFFKIDEKITEEENKKLQDILATNERRLMILGMETIDLIHQYYLERLQQQEELNLAENGVLTVKLQIDHDKLIVEIISASNLIPMDSNGQSDPFVRAELTPLQKFSFFIYKTKVLKKTLKPNFEEKFTVSLTRAQLEEKDALIKFTMKDHDLCKNRYMAEAFIRLSDAGKDHLKLFNLKLNRPKNADSEILKCLETRKNDKLARIFLKKEKGRLKTTL